MLSWSGTRIEDDDYTLRLRQGTKPEGLRSQIINEELGHEDRSVDIHEEQGMRQG